MATAAKRSRNVPMRAALYLRVSSAGQEDNYSLPTQEKLLREYSVARGYTIASVFREVHTASELGERPELNRLRADMERGAFDVLICLDPDRFSRNQVHTAMLQYFCEQAGVSLEFVLFDYEKSATGQFLLSARAFAAELELEKLKERTQRGMRARVASGKLGPKTVPPYGYAWRDATKAALDPDPATAPVMRRLFAEAARGETLRAIARRLNDEGIPTPTGRGKWHYATIRRMFLREEYAGVALAYKEKNTRVGGKRVRVARPEAERVVLPEGTIPALVSRETFDAVGARLELNKAQAIRNHRHPERFLLRAGFICCGYCGKAIGAYCGYSYRQHGRTYQLADRYRSNPHNTDCPTVWHNAPELDADVWAKVYAVLTDRAIIQREVARRRGADPTADARAAARRLLAEVERKQGNVAQTLADLDDPDSRAPLLAALAGLGDRKRALAAELAARDAQHAAWRVEQDNLDSLEAWCAKVGEGLEHASYERKRKALTALGVRVKLFKADRKPRYEFETAIGFGSPLDDHAVVTRHAKAAR